MRVRDVMTSPAHTISPDAPAWEAIGTMRKLRIRRLPVVDGGELVGIVTWTDVVRIRPPAIGGRMAVPSLTVGVQVRHLMTIDPITVAPDTSIEDAAAIMRRKKIGGLPVVEGRRLLGIVTESDLFDAFVGAFTARTSEENVHVPVDDLSARLPSIVGALEAAGVPILALHTMRGKDGTAVDVVVRKRDAARARKAMSSNTREG